MNINFFHVFCLSVSICVVVFDEKFFALILPEALPTGFNASLLLNLFKNMKILIPKYYETW